MLKRFLKDSMIYGLGGVAGRLVTVLLIPVYTRALDQSDYGRLDLLVSMSLVIGVLGGAQIEAGVIRGYYGAKRKGQHRALCGTGLVLRIIAGIAATVFAIGAFHFFALGRAGLDWEQGAPLIALILPGLLYAYAMAILQLERRARAYGIISAAEAATCTLLGILAVVVLQFGVAGVMWAMFASRFIWTLAALAVSRDQWQLSWRGDQARGILAFCVPIVPGVFCLWAQSNANRFIVGSAMSLSDLAVFSLAAKVASFIFMFDAAFRLTWTQYSMAILEDSDADQQYGRMIDAYFFSMLGIVAVLSGLALPAVILLSTTAYYQAATVVPLLCLAHIWNGSITVFSMGVKIVKRMHWYTIALGCGTAANIGLLALTINRFGLNAAACSALIGAGISAGLILFFSQRLHYIPYRKKSLLAALVASILLPLALSSLPQGSTSSLSSSLGIHSLRLGVALAIWILASLFILDRSIRIAIRDRLCRVLGFAPRSSQMVVPTEATSGSASEKNNTEKAA